ncbi:MAG: hypothetical protein H7A37_03765 [Chlamydiales bacterium]|nr:hypothetical protein [Chlamydiia bacterium]MCP5507403.1 hypothetical protein [Chlamydiales bacterium]
MSSKIGNCLLQYSSSVLTVIEKAPLITISAAAGAVALYAYQKFASNEVQKNENLAEPIDSNLQERMMHSPAKTKFSLTIKFKDPLSDNTKQLITQQFGYCGEFSQNFTLTGSYTWQQIEGLLDNRYLERIDEQVHNPAI